MSKDIYNPDHYLNDAGQDLFEEWYIRYPFEVFRIVMWCTAERYYRRYYSKNGLEDLNKGMRVMDRLKEYEERYSNDKYDKFKDESYLATQDMSSMYPPSTPSTQEWSGKDTDGDVEIFRANYYKGADVQEAVYKGLEEALAEDSSFKSRVIVDRLKTAIYDRLDALEAYSLYWGEW